MLLSDHLLPTSFTQPHHPMTKDAAGPPAKPRSHAASGAPVARTAVLRHVAERHQLVTFFCGNLELLLSSIADSAVDVMKVLQTQVAISMQRGAQSGTLGAWPPWLALTPGK